MMNVAVVGAGYVGLVTGACLAEKGYQVTCVDVDRSKVDRINHALPPIHENGLAELLERNVGIRLHATTDLASAIDASEVSLIAVGTPTVDGGIDLSFIRQAAIDIGQALRNKREYHVVAVKSTVVPGTTNNVVMPLLQEASGKRPGHDFGVAMNPEFLREGQAVNDFMSPDRVVIGGIDERSIAAMERLYAVFPGVEIIKTNTRTAEMIKYTANSLLATMISFSNEIANLCSALGDIDVIEVMQGVHSDRRISPILPNGERVKPGLVSYLHPGCGFGGSCFPKDVKALVAHGRPAGVDMKILRAVVEVNDQQPEQVLALLRRHFPSFENVRMAILGLAFKPGTDDMRESPAIPIVRTLLREKAKLKAFDPIARRAAEEILGDHDLEYCDRLADAIRGAQAIVLLTGWSEFNELPESLRNLQPQPVFIDGRRMFDKRSIAKYHGIGT